MASEIGYPVLVRPSYVLGGRAMEIVRTPETLERYVARVVEQFGEHPILIDHYLGGPRGRGRRDLRRAGCADPRHHGAHRARGRPLRR